jgi:hypothetical protein
MLPAALALAASLTCPNLSGSYNCPAYGTSQPASHMSVTQTDTGGVTTYSYLFDFSSAPSYSSASVAGMIDAGMLKFCSATTLYLGNITGTSAGAVQAHFLNLNGDYVVSRGDREVMHCTNATSVPTPAPNSLVL